DDVVIAALEPEVAVLVLHRDVTKQAPVATEFLAGCLRPAPVLQEHHGIGSPYCDDAGFTRWQDSALIVNDLDHMAGDGPTHRAGSHREQLSRVPDDEIDFGLAEELIERQAEGLLPPGDHVLAQLLTARADGSHIVGETGPRIWHLAHQAQSCWWHEDVPHAVLGEKRERPF